MLIETHLITFGASAVQFPAPSAAAAFGEVRRVHVEPLKSNTHVSYLGSSTVTNDGSGTGVIREFLIPSAATAPDFYEETDYRESNSVDPTQFYGHGTSGEKLKATYVIG